MHLSVEFIENQNAVLGLKLIAERYCGGRLVSADLIRDSKRVLVHIEIPNSLNEQSRYFYGRALDYLDNLNLDPIFIPF